MVFGWVSLAQSKKEQIRVLTNRVDSLNLVLNSERSDNSQRVEQLNRRVSELEENVRGMEIKLQEKDSENDSNKKQIEELRNLINVKSDSIMVLKAEVEKLKPTPKPVVQTNPVVATPSGPYKTVTIGTQIWMKENLNVSTFRNGDPIPEAKTAEEWQAAGEAKQPAWCYYDNDSKNGVKYGKLYNWYAVNDSRGLAPVGWHVPDNDEWEVLEGIAGGFWVAGESLKDSLRYIIKDTAVIEWGYSETIWKGCSNCSYWTKKQKELNYCSKCRNSGGSFVKGKYIPKSTKKYSFKDYKGGWNGNNISGFSALPSGIRNYAGNFYGIEDIRVIAITGEGGEACFWSSTNIDPKYSNARGLDGSQELFYDYDRELNFGFSIRCIKD